MSAKDPLLQPFQLKHLKLRNRILSTSHEPAYSYNPSNCDTRSIPKKAQRGIDLTKFGHGALVLRDAQPAYGNLYATDDHIMPNFYGSLNGYIAMAPLSYLRLADISGKDDRLRVTIY